MDVRGAVDLLEMMKDKKRIKDVEPNFYISPAKFKTYFKQVLAVGSWGFKAK